MSITIRCINKDDEIVSKINFLVFGVILSMLGIQGLLEFYNEKISSIDHIKTISYIILSIGITFILITFIRCSNRTRIDSRDLEAVININDNNDYEY